MLESLGYSVTIKTDGQRAWQEFKEHPEEFDLLVTDQTMPGVLGTDLASRFRQLNPKLKVIIITGYAMMEMARRAMDKGAFDFIAKPFKPDDLRNIILKAVSSPES